MSRSSTTSPTTTSPTATSPTTDDTDASDLDSYLAAQSSLIQHAHEAIPHQFNHCTYPLGPLRQPVYLCITCTLAEAGSSQNELNDREGLPIEGKGLCAACSVACHAEHDQLELFHKRAFRCDCPTSTLSHPCSLHPLHGKEAPDVFNKYGQNFRAVFCRCQKRYLPEREREVMVQCLVCEDWFHESCLNLRDRLPSREPSPEPSAEPEPSADPNPSSSRSPSPTPPPPLLPDTAYTTFICGPCVLKNPVLRRHAGTAGAKMVVRRRGGGAEEWTVLEDEGGREVEVGGPGEGEGEQGREAGGKRHREDDGENGDENGRETEGRDAKRVKLSSSPPLLAGAASHPPSNSNGKSEEPDPNIKSKLNPCLAPPPNSIAQAVLAQVIPEGKEKGNQEQDSEQKSEWEGAGDVFLTEGWRERWCQCKECLPHLQAQPYLLEEEETWEPEEDPDSGLSLEELGMRALARLPRDRAIDGIRAFNELRDELLTYLRPFAAERKVVGEADVKRFFEEREREREGRGK